MGWSVLSKCVIEFDDESKRIRAEEKIKELAAKENVELYEYAKDELSIYFDIYGNKFVDYKVLDELFEWCKTENIKLEISCIEYVEDSGSGYYKNSFEEQGDENEGNV